MEVEQNKWSQFTPEGYELAKLPESPKTTKVIRGEWDIFIGRTTLIEPTGEVIHVERMAEIYWHRLHFSAVSEVSMRLREISLGGDMESPTYKYWRDVLKILRTKKTEVNEKRRIGNA